MTHTALPNLPVIGVDLVPELALMGDIAAQRAEFERELNLARDLYMSAPSYRARVNAVRRALLDTDTGDRDPARALDNALRAVVVSDAASRAIAGSTGRPRGRIAVLASTVDDARTVALAAGIDIRDILPYTLNNAATTDGAILRGAIVAPDFAALLASGNAYAYDALMRLRRALSKTGLRL
jgi:hypothetical protein